MTRFGSYKSYACGGSLINDRYILTAGKCVKLFPPEMLSVTIGARKGNETTSLPSHDVSHVIIHEKYRRFFRHRRKHVYNDIALLKLKKPLNLKEDIPGDRVFVPVCLPDKHHDVNKKKLFVSGWAYPSLGGHFPSPPELIDSPVKEFGIKSCGRFYSKILRFNEKNVICAGGLRGVCFKDEGSPLLTKQSGHVTQIGLVSVSRGFADCSYRPKVPTIFERVATHLDWIKRHTKDANWCWMSDSGDDKHHVVHEDVNEIKETDFKLEEVKEEIHKEDSPDDKEHKQESPDY